MSPFYRIDRDEKGHYWVLFDESKEKDLARSIQDFSEKSKCNTEIIFLITSIRNKIVPL